ncbi:MAG: SAM-dependent methyltransferase [Gammaproteobacteria bacterium]|nr:SAM-dependent methyltransferase [Gammaproteobacteria bacterium]MDH4313606.1 SAM-dependent methyltransferase [Gammaproteobacteria bacterium]MDH5213343.1 SAM-dependent methyltransferase [Gammaproteobacteria bacterium]
MQVQTGQQSSLPAADPASAAHSEIVAGCLRSRIASAGGSISFAEFMQLALYAPGLGYYVAGSRKFGADGDFVTAPEVSPLFGRVLGAQCAPILGEIPGADILELGAGSGALAVQILSKLQELAALPERYRILEPSAELQSRQKSRVAELPEDLARRVEWITDWPANLVGIVLANEVADALPFARFVKRQDTVNELCVTSAGSGFDWCERIAPTRLAEAVRNIEKDIGSRLPDGYVSEVCLALPQWIADLADCVDRGMLFLFDYGLSRREYYAAERDQGWLRCHFRQRAHDNPLILPGIQDLTAWVDFSAVAEAAVKRGMQVSGYVTQAHFLLHGGLQDELDNFSELQIREQVDLSRQIKILTLPGEMGENFKCLGLAKNLTDTPAVFELSDRAHIL